MSSYCHVTCLAGVYCYVRARRLSERAASARLTLVCNSRCSEPRHDDSTPRRMNSYVDASRQAAPLNKSRSVGCCRSLVAAGSPPPPPVSRRQPSLSLSRCYTVASACLSSNSILLIYRPQVMVSSLSQQPSKRTKFHKNPSIRNVANILLTVKSGARAYMD